MQNTSQVITTSAPVVASGLYGSFLAYFTNLPDGVLVCAILGAAVYIMVNRDLTWKKQLFFFGLSFYIGTTSAAEIVALIMTKHLSIIGIEYDVDVALGALVVSAGGVSILLLIVALLQKKATDRVSKE